MANLVVLNHALEQFDALFIIPAYYVLTTVMIIIAGQLLYKSYLNFTPHTLAFFLVGLAVSLYGVFLMSYHEPDTDLTAIDDDFIDDGDLYDVKSPKENPFAGDAPDSAAKRTPGGAFTSVCNDDSVEKSPTSDGKSRPRMCTPRTPLMPLIRSPRLVRSLLAGRGRTQSCGSILGTPSAGRRIPALRRLRSSRSSFGGGIVQPCTRLRRTSITDVVFMEWSQEESRDYFCFSPAVENEVQQETSGSGTESSGLLGGSKAHPELYTA